MSGAPFAARYSFPPNEHGYCGMPTFRNSLMGYLSGSSGTAALEREIRKFPVHHAYLKLIARENGLRPFDTEVVRAFWIGNRLLEGISRESLAGFIEKDLFARRGDPRVRRLCRDMPEGLVPHHSFNPLYVNFVTDAVAKTVENYDACCITWGRILSVGDERIRVRRSSVVKGGGFSLRTVESDADLERSGVRLAGKLSPGDLVSVHWGMAVGRISRRDAEALRKYTLINIDAINSMG